MTVKKADSPYPEELLERLRNLLFAIRTRAAAEFRGLGEIALEPSGQDSSFEEPADYGSEEYAERINLDLLEQESDLLRELDEAIERLDGKGDVPYGLCEACENEPQHLCPTCPWITEERLLESPWVRHCAEVQRRDELETERET